MSCYKSLSNKVLAAWRVSVTLTYWLRMKKTFYYNFFPTKAQEEAAQARNVPHHANRVLVEVNDPGEVAAAPGVVGGGVSPWPIRRSLTKREILLERIELSQEEAFDHVFRYWTLEAVNVIVVGGSKYPVVIVDFTDERNPRTYHSEHVYLEKSVGAGGGIEIYFLRWTDLAKSRIFNVGDDIGILWDFRSGCFHFKLLQRGA
ncbi:hypothetical protein SAY86_004350 [Trapa natans]|uniref:Uncharacterized protein n=1 Tax=Trapa natans TaxID=22666 RepID=A0AAN7N6G1_TRANT|nr:hypothetical protein SAY86_004350 [Trapa natans]